MCIDKKWVSQAVSSLGFETVWDRKLFMKSWYNSKNLYEYCWFYICCFLCQTVSIPPNENVSISSDQYVCLLLVSNIYNGNIGTIGIENYVWKLPIVWNLCACCEFW